MNFALGIIALATLISAGLFAGRRSANATAANEWRQEAEAIRHRADRLHDDLDAERKANHALQAQVVKLESLPDMTLLLKELSEQRKGAERQTVESMRVVTEMFDRHETRAHERHRATLESFQQLNSGLAAVNQSLRQMNGHEGRKGG